MGSDLSALELGTNLTFRGSEWSKEGLLLNPLQKIGEMKYMSEEEMSERPLHSFDSLGTNETEKTSYQQRFIMLVLHVQHRASFIPHDQLPSFYMSRLYHIPLKRLLDHS